MADKRMIKQGNGNPFRTTMGGNAEEDAMISRLDAGKVDMQHFARALYLFLDVATDAEMKALIRMAAAGRRYAPLS